MPFEPFIGTLHIDCTREKASWPSDWPAPNRTSSLAERFEVHLTLPVSAQGGLPPVFGYSCTYKWLIATSFSVKTET